MRVAFRTCVSDCAIRLLHFIYHPRYVKLPGCRFSPDDIDESCFYTTTMLNDWINSLPPAYRWPAQLCIFTTAATYILSVITSNVSQVDRLWTFLPTIYTAYYALLPLWPNQQPFILAPYSPKDLGWTVATDFSPRALLIFGLVFIWMCRSVLAATMSSAYTQ
jgi:hypothetical protein